MTETKAEIRLPTQELRADLPFYMKQLGFRLDMIYPADDPQIAVLSGHGLRLRIEKGAAEAPGTIRILTDDAGFAGGARSLTAPNGTRIEVDELNPPVVTPATEHAFVVRRLADQAPWVIGRAGMEYRDLIPTRLGGAMIASHIRVPDGPVPDMVHYHKVGFQLIFCVAGWVDVLYEDQGDVRRIHAGDCFIQPPTIRHKVLHSEGVQVVEIGVPAEHVTEIDHEMKLPTPHFRPEREWDGQRFVHNIGRDGTFAPFRIPGFEARDTTIHEATKGVVTLGRPRTRGAFLMVFPPRRETHDQALVQAPMGLRAFRAGDRSLPRRHPAPARAFHGAPTLPPELHAPGPAAGNQQATKNGDHCWPPFAPFPVPPYPCSMASRQIA